MRTSQFALHLLRILRSPVSALFVAVVAIMVTVVLDGANSTLLAISIFASAPILLAIFAMALFIIDQRTSPTTHLILSEATYRWTIMDLGGKTAKIEKETKGVITASGITFQDEKSFGGGEPTSISSCHHSDGIVIDVARRDKEYIGIRLNRAYHQDDVFDWKFTREMHNCFTQSQEWVGVDCDTKINGALTIEVVFPSGARIHNAWLTTRKSGKEKNRDLLRGSEILDPRNDGESPRIRGIITIPEPGSTYTIQWRWNGGASDSISIPPV